MSDRSQRLAYVVAEYPKISHTFVTREIEALRRLGVTIDTVSIRRTPSEGLLSDSDRAEAAATFAVLPVRVPTLVGAHIRWLARNPWRYVSTLLLAFRGPSRGLRRRLWQLFYFAEAGVLADELRTRGTEHLHAHFVNVACSVAMLAASLLRKPFSFTMHGPLEFDNVDDYGIAEKVRRAEFVACISDYCRAQLMRLVEPADWSRLHVVHCGVDPATFLRREEPNRNARPIRIGSIGRLAPMKAFGDLIEAVAQVHRGGEPVTLTVIGDGPERKRLEALARRELPTEAVQFLGALAASDIPHQLAEMDIFCLPSFAEGVPVVLMEAMASGLPIVATAVMGIPELVRPDAGVLVPPARPDKLAEALLQYVHDPDARRSAGEAGRAFVATHYDIDDAARTLAVLFAGAS